MIGEFASQGDAVDHVMLVNLSLERTAKVQLKDLLSLGRLEEYSPQDGHLAKCGGDVCLPAGQGVLLKLTRLIRRSRRIPDVRLKPDATFLVRRLRKRPSRRSSRRRRRGRSRRASSIGDRQR